VNNSFTNIITNPERTLFVGLGNRFRNDDYVGVYICETLRENSDLNILIAENSLENHIGKINKMNPEQVIIVDALQFNREPGFFDLISVKDIKNDTGNTHTISLRQLAGLIMADPVTILGIQPLDVSFGTSMSLEVIESARIIVQQLIKLCLRNHKTMQP